MPPVLPGLDIAVRPFFTACITLAQELLLAGHFWGPGSLPEELGDLVQLVRLDLSGLPYLHDWLRDPAARRRHKLGPSRDSSRVTLQVCHTARCLGGIFAEFKLPQSSSGSARFSCPRFAVLVHGCLLPADGSGVFGLRRGSPDPRHHVWSGARQPAAPNYPSYREMGYLECH